MVLTVRTTISGDEITTITKGAQITVDAYDVVDATSIASSASDYEVALSPGNRDIIENCYVLVRCLRRKNTGNT